MKTFVTLLLLALGLCESHAQIPGNAPAGTVFGNYGITPAPGKWLSSRKRLTATLTIYARTGGSDTLCSGLTNANNPGSGTAPRACAFATIQKALDTIANNYDLNGRTDTTVNIGCTTPPCTFSGVLLATPWTGAGPNGATGTNPVTVVGDVTTPSNAVISGGAAPAVQLEGGGTSLGIKGVKLTSTGSGNTNIVRRAFLGITGLVDLGSAIGGHLTTNQGGQITCQQGVTGFLVSGGANTLFSVNQNSIIVCPSMPFNFTVGSLNFASSIAAASIAGTMNIAGNTYVGTGAASVTSPAKFSASFNGVINGASAITIGTGCSPLTLCQASGGQTN